MREIPWDEIAHDAMNSPRAILESYLERVDEIENVIVIALRRDDLDTETIKYDSTGSRFLILGMVEWVANDLKRNEQ